MRIKELILSESEIHSLGLTEFKTNRLNNTLALVGKNGSGKTRYLNAIENKLKKIDIVSLLDGELEFLPTQLESQINAHKKNLKLYRIYKEFKEIQERRKNNPKSKELTEELKIIRQQFNRESSRIPFNQNAYNKLNNDIQFHTNKRIKVIKPDDFRRLKASLDLNSNRATFQNIIDSTDEDVNIDEFSMISDSALTYLKRLPHKLSYDAIDTKGDEKKFKNRVSYKRFNLLRQLVNEFLGKTLEWESKTSNVDEYDDHISIKSIGFWKIDGREFDYAQFSEGEKVLFTYAILLFLLNTNPRIRFKESIIIIDEPELNLHPKAQIKLIESLQELVKDEGQLIIATHSLSIVANLQYGSIHLVRDSKLFSPSSTIPFESVDDLMGFDEHYNKIVEFLVSTPSWAMINFMGECFEDPEVFEEANNNDPQLEIFKNIILTNNSINILDFGSGKGRLIEKIRESEKTWKRIKSYDCFDIQPKYNELVNNLGANNVYNDLSEIPNNHYDLVVLVNVLHEIPINEWTKSINTIKKNLKPDGFLAIIEDTELPVGELPNEHGFLILGKEEMTNLLGIDTTFISSKIERYKNRILCGVIKGDLLKKNNKNVLKSTLSKLKENSLNSIIEYRKSNESELSLGRLYALKANLYVNSELAINQLE
ncbi:AAA family ATPase [Pontimicrobium sp. IMCC45349]|uniref:AAA family ATPase n=1 Tax=Pontimicrobium sp. IMCC45349 TaxID=3391574 RepID=UPI00399FBCD1